MKTIAYAIFVATAVLYAILSTNHRVAVVVPYCLDAAPMQPGYFVPCSELKRYYEA